MSAFIVSPECMHKCVRGFRTVQGMSFGGDRLARIAPTLAALKTPSEIGQALYEMNHDAVMEHYDDKAYAKIPKQYRYKQPNSTLVEQYKALACLRYQCSEGTVPAESLLYQELAEIMHSLADDIVCALPEWETAPWG